MSKDAIYFNHDYNARNDPKLVNVRMNFGWEGYGIFWALIEIMREENAMLKLSDCNAYAFQLHLTPDRMRQYLNFFIEVGLLVMEPDGDKFFSKRLMNDFHHMKERSKKAKESAKARWKKSDPNTTAMRTHSEGNAKEERREEDSIGENSREEERCVETTTPQAEENSETGMKISKSENPPAPRQGGGDTSSLEQPKKKEEKNCAKKEESPPLQPFESNPFEASKVKHLDCVYLHPEELRKLESQYKAEGTKRLIEILNNHKMGTGTSYPSDYYTILNWVVDRYRKETKSRFSHATNQQNHTRQPSGETAEQAATRYTQYNPNNPAYAAK